ncbi:unnamed protein product [Thelazia callipaeda]|uniref:Major sperm protein n=1 Tax=Thelazia callipaeda TaxID=103827 RepID=A0A0N5D0I9_THECL|nr:unnamed protein product [Thelazia callipaeda]
MSKASQVLMIEPSHELTFKGPFNDVVTCDMRLTNPTDRPVCFKVKTTAPKQYCVRPNSGLLAPGETWNVAVMLQPFDSIGNIELEHSKHKFMVQSLYAPSCDSSLDDIWKNAQSSELMDSKLRVVFENPPTMEFTRDRTPPRVSSESKSYIAGPVTDMDAEMRRVTEEKNKAEAAKANLERDNKSLKIRLAELEAIPQVTGIQISKSGFELLHVSFTAWKILRFQVYKFLHIYHYFEKKLFLNIWICLHNFSERGSRYALK